MQVLKEADPADKAEACSRLGVTLTYHLTKNGLQPKPDPRRSCMHELPEGRYPLACPERQWPTIHREARVRVRAVRRRPASCRDAVEPGAAARQCPRPGLHRVRRRVRAPYLSRRSRNGRGAIRCGPPIPRLSTQDGEKSPDRESNASGLTPVGPPPSLTS
jgi:hypothetical protein